MPRRIDKYRFFKRLIALLYDKPDTREVQSAEVIYEAILWNV